MSSKIFRDPVHGNLLVPRGLLVDLVDSPEFQRLRHIRQLGMCYTTFHGAEHSRFQHALGVLHLMLRVLAVWQQELDYELSPPERDALCAAALLHDLGHGPFSHALERIFVGVSHEALGHRLIEKRLAPIFARHGRSPHDVIDILTGRCQRPVLHELISSQLDVDRMDYLQRDALYTGAKYGLFDCERILYSLRPIQDGGREVLALSPKGTEAVEEFLFSRYYMHWQVYFHRTVRSAELLLRAILERAYELWQDRPESLELPRHLVFLFEQGLSGEESADALPEDELLDSFVALDDTDVLQAIKLWSRSEDPVLSDLAHRFLGRRLYKVLVHPGQGPVLDAIRSVVSGYFPGAEQYYLREDTPWDVGLNSPPPGGEALSPIRVVTAEGGWRELSQMTRTQAVRSLGDTVAQAYLMIPPECRPQVEHILRM